jgi:uncharacterized membrane protein YoaK (UPF0700 family)
MELRSHRHEGRLTARTAGFARRLLGTERSEPSDRYLGLALTFIAGAINAGGFLAVGQYTSHMSGVVAAMADNTALGFAALLVAGLGALLPFIAGAASSAVLINWARRTDWESPYSLPLALEACLLLAFGATAMIYDGSPAFVATVVGLLCFIMGLQNATVTKISGARMRTTHVTGIVTDIGIELGKLGYRNSTTKGLGRPPVLADRAKLVLLVSLLASFFSGGVVGAVGFKAVGMLFSLPLALVLLMLAGPALVEDVLMRRRDAS